MARVTAVTVPPPTPGAPIDEALHRMLRDEIIDVLTGSPDRWTPGAVSWSVGRGARGVLGQDPDPAVAVELAGLAAEGTIAELAACPVCGDPGTLHLLSERLTDEDEGAAPLSGDDIREAMEPLIAEGLIEISEIVEFVERECCARTLRAWRRAPRPI